MVKADLDSPPQSTAVTTVVKDLLIRHYGKLEVAARLMGNMDKSQLSRDLGTGHFRMERLEMLADASFYAALGRELLERFGPLATPKARARQKVREIKSALDEVEQALELIA